MDHSIIGMAQGKYLGWRLLGGRQSIIVNCASTRPVCFMRQGKVAQGYGLQMTNLPVLCLLELEQGSCELPKQRRCECCPAVFWKQGR